MKLTKRQKWITGIIGTSLLGGGAWLGMSSGLLPSLIGQDLMADSTTDKEGNIGERQGMAPTLPGIQVHQVGSYVQTVGHSGVLQTRSHTMVAFQRGGMIKKLLVDEGQRVTANQVLAILDQRHLDGQIVSLQARLDQANSVLAEMQKGPRQEAIQAARSAVNDLDQQLKAQQLRLERSGELLKSNSIARQDYERELYAKRGLDARLKTSQSQLDELLAGTRNEKIEAQLATIRSIKAEQEILQYDVDDCQLKAPFGGRIVSRILDPGAVVGVGNPVFELIDDQQLELQIGIPTTFATQLQSGQTFEGEADGHSFQATLRTVLPLVDPSTRTCKAIFDVNVASNSSSNLANSNLANSNLGAQLFSGQMAKLNLVRTVEKQGFWIPTSALAEDHSGLWSCFVVLNPKAVATSSVDGETFCVSGVAAKQSVEILDERAEQVFVRGTLEDKQIVVSAGVHRIVSGQMISVQIGSSELSNTIMTSAEDPAQMYFH